MFGYGRGYGFGGGWGRGGFGRGFGPGGGACVSYYMTHGTWPAWSRWAGGPGYWRAMVAQNVAPDAWTPPAAPMDEVQQLRQEVQQLRTQIDEALRRLSERSA
ncbi:MAG: hypothetical protein ACP5HM_11135 [Anaerolineae bacterium]